MQCEHAQEFFSEYVIGEMDAALAITLQHHLDACESCKETVGGLRSMWSTLDNLPHVEPPESFHTTLMERIAAEQAREERAYRAPAARVPSWRSMLQPRVFAYAAVVLVLFLGAEAVQVQRAALGPLGLIMNVLHPTPLMRTQRAELTSNNVAAGFGGLTVRLRAHELSNGATANYRVRIQVPQLDSTSRYATAEVSSDRMTVVTIHLDAPLNAASDRIKVSIVPSDSDVEVQSFTLPITTAR